MSQRFEHGVTMSGCTIEACQKLDELMLSKYDGKDLCKLTDELRLFISKVD